VTFTLEEAAAHWDMLADQEINYREKNLCGCKGQQPCGCKEVSRNREQSYRNTAKALRMQIETGIAHCSCHLLPMDKCRELATKRIHS
jgi:hypothetical protein